MFYFSFNFGAVMADLVVHRECKDNPHLADIILEFLFGFPIIMFYYIISFFD